MKPQYPYDCSLYLADGRFKTFTRYAGGTTEAMESFRGMVEREYPELNRPGLLVAEIYEEDARKRGLPWGVS